MKKFYSSMIVFFLLVNSVYAKEKLVASATPSAQPYAWSERNEIIGASVELAKLIFSDLGVEVEFRHRPWARSLMEIEQGTTDLLLTVFYTRERAQLMEFTVPYAVSETSIFVAKGKAFSYTKWADLIGRIGVGIIGDSNGELFDNFAKEKLKIKSVSRMLQMFRLLDLGRVDYAVYTKASILIEAERLGFSNSIEVLPVSISTPEVFFGISKKSPFLKYLPKINRKINQLRENGTIDRLVEDAILRAYN
jgi:polar amino acid transport system substrate-binding protein